MSRTTFISLFLLVMMCLPAAAQRQLPQEELLEIFQQICSRPQKTWLPFGSIEADCRKYSDPLPQ